ncbi:ABC transporter substrate-binding protein [Arcobacter sp.]|uniref:ABC transporter substrate-binding protein n=1 Tax=unclassified Arcobacter TaxID=2593671 RepID=UPI003AFF7C30
MKKIFILFFSLFLFFSFIKAENHIAKKRVFYVNSYHSGLYWSDGIEKSIKETLLKSKVPIEFKRVEMDSKRNNNEAYKIKTAQKIKNQIENFKPDVIITSDDNAFKYVILPYFKNSTIPIIFCGINGTIMKYEQLPNNITGMEEVQLIAEMIETLKSYLKKEEVAYLKGDSFSSINEVKFFEKRINKKIDARFVKTVKEWKENFKDLQNNAGILLIGNGGAIKGWTKHEKELENFVKEHIKIPIVTWDYDVMKLSVLGYTTKPEEQGEWAAKTAIRVLQGEDIRNIPIVTNKKANIYINTTLAKKLNIVFPFELIDNAVLVK